MEIAGCRAPDLDYRHLAGGEAMPFPDRGQAAEGWRALREAWERDDGGDERAAQCARLRAAAAFARAVAAGEGIAGSGSASTQLLLTDVLRRAGRFDAARERCHRGLSGRPKEPHRSLLEFELELIGAGDTAAHSASEALPKWR
ncbi:MAG: hypothetical protein FJW90_12390 [Actinobacteria bacterium]|nr:hypothetical protein [Actinomycetota bacterium]